jgi:hypothetical protein
MQVVRHKKNKKKTRKMQFVCKQACMHATKQVSSAPTVEFLALFPDEHKKKDTKKTQIINQKHKSS